MMSEKKYKNRPLADALDYIDMKYIDEALGSLTLPLPSGAYKPNKRKAFSSAMKFAVRAACAVLVVGVVLSIPTIINNLEAFIGPGNFFDDTNTDTDTQDDIISQLNITVVSSPVQLDRLDITRIMSSFLSGKDQTYLKYSYRLECYWKSDDVYVVNIFSQEKSEENVYKSFTNGLKICANNDICTLSYGYSESVINDSDLISIVDAYNDYLGYAPKIIYDTTVFSNVIPPVQLTDVEIYELVYAYINRYPNLKNNVTEGCAIRCIKKKNGVYEFYFDATGLAYLQAITVITTSSGLTFRFKDSQVTVIYHDGQIYSLEEADTAGLLSLLYKK